MTTLIQKQIRLNNSFRRLGKSIRRAFVEQIISLLRRFGDRSFALRLKLIRFEYGEQSTHAW